MNFKYTELCLNNVFQVNDKRIDVEKNVEEIQKANEIIFQHFNSKPNSAINLFKNLLENFGNYGELDFCEQCGHTSTEVELIIEKEEE